jgi:predicted LPLAT superfamily acyltransferase
MKETTHRYRVLIRSLQTTSADPHASRRERASALAQRFADEMDDVVRRYPTQWFNYYEFWNEE